MTLQVSINRIDVPAAADIADLRREFAGSHCIRLPRFFDERLLGWLRAQLARAPFRERVHSGIVPPPVDLGLADDGLRVACGEGVLALLKR